MLALPEPELLCPLPPFRAAAPWAGPLPGSGAPLPSLSSSRSRITTAPVSVSLPRRPEFLKVPEPATLPPDLEQRGWKAQNRVCGSGSREWETPGSLRPSLQPWPHWPPAHTVTRERQCWGASGWPGRSSAASLPSAPSATASEPPGRGPRRSRLKLSPANRPASGDWAVGPGVKPEGRWHITSWVFCFVLMISSFFFFSFQWIFYL